MASRRSIAQHILRLLAHGVGRALAAPHGALAVARAALARLAAARDDEAFRRRRRRHGVRKGMERRLGRRRDLGAHIAARHRIDGAVEQAPVAQRHHVDLVEGAEALLREGRGRAQLAGAERGERAAGRADDAFDAREALRERHRLAEAHALDRIAIACRDAARVLEDRRDEAIVAGGEFGGRGHAWKLRCGFG
jgi:hypothetical protein